MEQNLSRFVVTLELQRQMISVLNVLQCEMERFLQELQQQSWDSLAQRRQATLERYRRNYERQHGNVPAYSRPIDDNAEDVID